MIHTHETEVLLRLGEREINKAYRDWIEGILERCAQAEAALADLRKKTPESITKTADEWLVKLEGTGLPCGHKLADLIGGKDAVTKCGACLAELKKRRDEDIAVNHRPYCKAKNPSVCTGGCW